MLIPDYKMGKKTSSKLTRLLDQKWVSVEALLRDYVVVPRKQFSEIVTTLDEMAFGHSYHPRQEREQEICDNIVKLKMLLEAEKGKVNTK